MQFYSPTFIVFLLAILLALSLPLKLSAKKCVLLISSCLFYAAWDYRYLALLLAISGVDFVAANIINRSEDNRYRWRILVLSIVTNLGTLGYFKYYNFFLENLNGILASIAIQLPYKEILLPAGISFYTFKSMSYTIDVYRKHIKPCDNYLDYATFISFFPELIAGPIVRASVFLAQMNRDIGPNKHRMFSGLSLFLIGFTKKCFIADRAASIIDPIFANPSLYSSTSIWMAAFGYSIQIYCDFSGYSDMAIGTARMIGYDLPENFNLPYLSKNVTEFWRRWHITLSSWLRDYLYIPLGGNRKGVGRSYLNLLITMFLGGLWHGASWNFVLWGSLHGCALAGHKLLITKWPNFSMPKSLSVLVTFLFVTICWVPFRAKDWATTGTMLKKMLSLSDGAVFISWPLVFLICLVGLGHALGYSCGTHSDTTLSKTRKLLNKIGFTIEESAISGWSIQFSIRNFWGTFVVIFWILVLFYFTSLNNSPFIYFQF